MISESADAVVVGGGVAGLMAARALHARGLKDVVVFEADERAGGRVKSVRYGPYWANLGAQFLAGSGPLFDLADELGIEYLNLAPYHAGLASGGRVVRSDQPLRLPLAMRGPLSDRLSIARVGLDIFVNYWQIALRHNRKKARRRRGRLETIAASQLFAGAKLGSAGEQLMRCLVRFWMGAEPEEVAAAHAAVYLGLSLMNLRRLPPFATPIGGTEELVKGLRGQLTASIVTEARVVRVRQDTRAVKVSYRLGGEQRSIGATACVVATPAYVSAEIVEDIPESTVDALKSVRYGTYVSVGIFTNEDTASAWDDYYMITPLQGPFQALINPVAALRPLERKREGGSLLAYAGGEPARELMECPDEEISTAFTSNLCEMFPSLAEHIVKTVVQRWPAAVPYWGPGDGLRRRTLTRPFGRICFAGDYAGYPSMQVAASSGISAVEALGHAFRDESAEVTGRNASDSTDRTRGEL
ncbi:MAG: flavin monoamine oxidase family protein [Acidimicrobiales bacterium]